MSVWNLATTHNTDIEELCNTTLKGQLENPFVLIVIFCGISHVSEVIKAISGQFLNEFFEFKLS